MNRDVVDLGADSARMKPIYDAGARYCKRTNINKEIVRTAGHGPDGRAKWSRELVIQGGDRAASFVHDPRICSRDEGAAPRALAMVLRCMAAVPELQATA